MPRGTRRSARTSAPAAAKAAKAAEHESADAAQDVPASDHDDENEETAGRANEEVANETVHQSLAHLLTTLSKPEDLLTTIFMPAVAQSDGGGGGGGGDRDGEEITSLLRSASRTLFGRLEQLAAMEERLRRRRMAQQEDGEEDGGVSDDAAEAPLSGLTELYTGEADDSADGDMAVDAETLWGQVDLQNEALLPKLRKSVRSLAKAIDREGPASVKLLDFGDLTDNDNEDSGNEDDESRSGSEQDDDDDDDASDEEEKDDEARRIRERMEKAMAEMSDEDMSDGESDDEESDGPTATKRAKKMSSSHVAQSKGGDDEEEDLEDPAADELNDGFFDINEMEAFADEEEDYLPEEMDAVVEEERRKQKNAKKAKLPHQRQRQGEESDDSEDEDDVDREEPSHAKRKKYRDDDEIDALYNLYQEAHSDGESDDEEEDVADMTASDFFGLPNKRYLRAKKGQDIGKAKSLAKVKSSMGGDDSKEKKVFHEEEDVDSWDEHSFGDEEHDDDDDGPGWRDEHPEGPDKARGKDSDDDNDDNGGESSSDEEEEGSDDEQMEAEEEEKEPERQTRHAISSTTLLKQTEELEKEALAEKPWQMTGESKGTQRPTNSLLEATPEFEVANKMAPIITVEHTENIEEMIKKRVIDEDWDDVVPRELPDIGLGKRKGELPEVSQEKSKLGLGELYEREYLKKVAGYDKDAVERETEEDKVKNEMKALFANLCSQLDALSNYHFAPRPVADEAEIRTVATPAIAMEEALPLHVSDARGVAPEEVYAAKQGRGSIIRGESEMDQTERKRLRNAKKGARRKARKAKLADEKLISKLQPGLGLNNPYEKRKLREELQMARASGKVTEGEIDANKDYTTSTKFFQRMQENVAMEVHGEGTSEGRKRKRDDQSAQRKSSAYKL